MPVNAIAMGVAASTTSLPEAERDAQAEAFLNTLGIDIRHGGDLAYYAPSGDFIQMPLPGAFRDGAAYYSVLAHECVHATGHSRRLDRNLKGRFGSEAYALEEMITELGAAMICADLGLCVNTPNGEEPRFNAD